MLFDSLLDWTTASPSRGPVKQRVKPDDESDDDDGYDNSILSDDDNVNANNSQQSPGSSTRTNHMFDVSPIITRVLHNFLTPERQKKVDNKFHTPSSHRKTANGKTASPIPLKSPIDERFPMIQQEDMGVADYFDDELIETNPIFFDLSSFSTHSHR